MGEMGEEGRGKEQGLAKEGGGMRKKEGMGIKGRYRKRREGSGRGKQRYGTGEDYRGEGAEGKKIEGEWEIEVE